jgi:dTMP kinase
MSSSLSPLFVVFEGIDGSGTTTQIELLVARLRRDGHDVVQTREPGGTPLGERIRPLVLDPSHGPVHAVAELFLVAAARAQHARERIGPALAAGKPVICDRYAASTVAYQGAGRGLDADLISQVNAAAMGGIVPDMTVLLELAVGRAAERRQGREGEADRMEQAGPGLQAAVGRAYARLAEANEEVWLRVDGTRGADELSEHIHQSLVRRWPEFPFKSE